MYTFPTNKLHTKRFTHIVKKKRINILDFGCGVGAWSESDIKNKSFKKITLFDKNRKLISSLKKKYKDKKININFNKKEIFKKKYDLVVLCSVIQYISKNEFKKLIVNLKSKSKKTTFLIIDIAKYPRYFEFILLPLFNIKRFLVSIGLILNKDYIKTKKYHHNFENYNFLKKKYKIEKILNVCDLKFLRYTLVIKEK